MQKPSLFQVDSPEEAREWHNSALALMEQYRITPAPVCHLTAYEYASGRNQALNRRIEQKLATKATIDALLLKQLFEEFYLDTQETELLESHISDLHQRLYQVLQGVTHACSHTELFDETLRQQSRALSGNPSVEDLRTIAATRLEAATRSIEQNGRMKEQLQRVERQTQSLKDELSKLRDEVTTDPHCDRVGEQLHVERRLAATAGYPEKTVQHGFRAGQRTKPTSLPIQALFGPEWVRLSRKALKGGTIG